MDVIKRIDWVGVFLFGLLAIVVIVGFVAIVAIIINVDNPAWYCNSRSNVSQECIDYRMHNCLDTELYSHDECVILTSGE